MDFPQKIMDFRELPYSNVRTDKFSHASSRKNKKFVTEFSRNFAQIEVLPKNV